MLFLDFGAILNYPSNGEFGIGCCMIQKCSALAAWLLLLFIAYATLSPIQARPTISTSPDFEHLAAFAILGMLFYLAYPRRVALVCLIVLGSAVVLEFSQLLTPDRHGRISDALEKLAGGVVGIMAGGALLFLAQARRWFKA
jgi:VanZ family protein